MRGASDLERVADLVGQADRSVLAVLLLRRGLSPEAVRERLWTLTPGGVAMGVSERARVKITRDGVRLLLSAVLRDVQPASVPDELWPPEAVRATVRARRSAPHHAASRKALVAWIEGDGDGRGRHLLGGDG